MTEVAVVCSVRERIEVLITDEATWEKSSRHQVLHLNSKLAEIENLLKKGRIYNWDLDIQAIQQLAHVIENTVEFLALQQGSLSSKLKTLWMFNGFFEFPLAKINHQAIELQKLKDILSETYGDDDFVSLEYHLLEEEGRVVGKPLNPATENVWRILSHLCCGLPLAIVLISARLRFKRLDLSEALYALEDYQNYNLEYCQKKCLQNYKTNNFMTSENVEYLSYKHLPFQLKPCFLYLGCFRRGEVIHIKKLYLLWMAEGFVAIGDQGHQKRMDAVKHYLLLLDQRSLGKLHYEDSSSQTLKYCELYGKISDFCVSMGHGEGFSGRRITIYLDTYEGDDSLNISRPEHILSLIFISVGGSTPRSTWSSQISDLKKFQSARVIDFNGVDFRTWNLPKGIEKLVFLRHLSFRGCNLDKLPSPFTKLPYLETLDLYVKPSCKMTIPNIVWKMSSLRHLYFPEAFISATGEKLKLCGLKKLEVLENFHNDTCDADDLPTLRKLQIFKGIADMNNENINKLIRFIHGNDQLCHTSLAIRNLNCNVEERYRSLRTLLKCDPLHVLNIEGYLHVLQPLEAFGLNFPRWFLRNLHLTKTPCQY